MTILFSNPGSFRPILFVQLLMEDFLIVVIT